MDSLKVLVRAKAVLPWRIRRRLEKLALAALRFETPQGPLFVRNGDPRACLVAVGDIALAGPFNENPRLLVHKKNLLPLLKIFEDSDFRIGNLETPLTNIQPHKEILGSFLKALPQAVKFLSLAGFKLLSLANNHARDCGLSGLLECRQILTGQGIECCGAGRTSEEARSPAVLEVAGIRVGMLAYCDNFRVSFDPAENVSPPEPREDWIWSDIQYLRSRVDFLIVQLHWGWEFSFYPPLSYRDRARRIADMGVDLVLCHHAHVPMGVEVWGTSVVSHGLGNFIFPPDRYIISGHPWTSRTYALKVYFDKKGVLYAQIIPCMLDSSGIPNIAKGSAAAEILGGIRRASLRLSDDKFLKLVEDDRTVREITAIFNQLKKADMETAREWARQLHSPFRRDLIRRLAYQHGEPGKLVAEFMWQLASRYKDRALGDFLRQEIGRPTLTSAVSMLGRAYPVDGDLPGQIP